MSAILALGPGLLAGGAGAAACERPWSAPLREVDDALARRDLRAASQALLRAGVLARGSPGWEPMLAVAEAARQVAHASGRPALLAEARASYLAAALRARAEGSADGVMRACEGLDRLGDRSAVELCVTIAQSVERGGPSPAP